MTCLVIRSSFVVQAYGSLEEEWDSQRFMSQMLRKFQTFANKVFNIFHFCRIIFCQVIDWLGDSTRWTANVTETGIVTMQWSCSPAALTTMMCGQVWRFFLFSFGARPWGWWWYLILGWVQGLIILSVDIANLWKAVNRIIMGKFSFKQIELQALVAPRGKNDFGTLFFWVQNIGPKNFCPNLGGVF